MGDPMAPSGKSRRLSDVVREVKIAAAEREDVVVDMKEADKARLELLAEELAPVFKEVPAGGDCYTLKFIIHDWGDDSSKTILSNIAKAMNPEGRVLLVEAVMPDSPEPHPAKFMDINMLAMTEGGCERTEKEYTELLAASGLKLEKIHPTQSPVCVLEAVKA